jgi:hypothetical protein
MCKELPRMAGVFRSDEIDYGERCARTRRHVFEIPYRRRDHI